MVGREDMLGAQPALGVGTVTLQRVLHRYLYVLMAQLAAAAACLRFHRIDPRRARWLLMSQDRAQADRFRVTHEFLAYMLGVRRVGITATAGGLQRNGLIKFRRGNLSVLDRPGLEAAACTCYGADRQAYRDVLG
jgi:CRP-like cAMP-binding protein